MNMYFTAIVLPRELNEQILQYKNFMHEKFGCRVGLNSPAHITILSPFWMNEIVEPEFFKCCGPVSKTDYIFLQLAQIIFLYLNQKQFL